MVITPHIATRGMFQFRPPWTTTQGVVYTVIAIRSFEDIYRDKGDVYEEYYKPVGLVNGDVVNGKPFNFDEEVLLSPNIVTFKGTDGSVLNIPSTYITQIPTANDVPYSEIILNVSLGPLPDYLDIEEQIKDIQAYIGRKLNVKTKVNRGKLPLLTNPTFEEHALMEKTRLGKSIYSNDPNDTDRIRATTQMELEKALEKIKEQESIIKSFIRILDDNGLMTTLT